MSNVQELYICCSFDPFDATPMHPLALFMQSLYLPAVALVKIRVDLVGVTYHTKAVELDVSVITLGLLPSPTSCPARMVDIVVHIERSVEAASAIFYMPFQRFPALQDLSLQIDGSIFLSGNIGLVFPSLKRLSINGCWSGSLPFVREVVDRLNAAHGAEHKLRVSLKDCAFVTEEEAFKLDIIEDIYLEVTEMEVPILLRRRLDKLGLLPPAIQ